MGTQLASNFISATAALITLVAVIVAIVAIHDNRKQTRDNWEHTQQLAREDRLHAQQLATDERQHQSRPIIVPIGEFETVSPYIARGNTTYKGDRLVNWTYPDPIQLELQNMGGGVALNVHCVLYGSESIHTYQFVSWDNGPIGDKPVHVKFEHPKQFYLSPDDSIDGSQPIFDTSPNSPSNPVEYRIACLTITYQDLFDNKYMSIFNHTLDHQWLNVKIDKIPSLKGKPPLDLKELNNQKRQQAPKFSAPAPQTSQGN
jgi:hypothetical protein